LAALLLWAVRQRMEFARLCLYNPIRDCNRPCIQLDASHRWARNSSAAARRVRWAARYMTDRFPPDVLQAAHLMAESRRAFRRRAVVEVERSGRALDAAAFPASIPSR